jgi:lysophospholipase L1-like esterase
MLANRNRESAPYAIDAVTPPNGKPSSHMKPINPQIGPALTAPVRSANRRVSVGARTERDLPNKPRIRIFFFGDSICFGQGVSPHLTWVTRLSQALDERFSTVADILTQNPSVNGNTTRMALERMPYDVQSHAPDVLYIQFGLNDCNGWETDKGCPRVSKDAFAANLGEMVERGRIFGGRQIILGTNHPTTRTARLPYVDYTYEEANVAYNAIIRRVAKAKGTRLADAERAFNEAVNAGKALYADLVLADQLHLSRTGHDIYLRNQLPILSEAVEAIIACAPTELALTETI